ncbi:unnamed protein product [Ilex paraguariensis]|uniref:Uncharacterized protein n=1 Tax=Ilex paraguariensis TaxID=185542 RepID=A0ABC8UAB0_9AQUA
MLCARCLAFEASTEKTNYWARLQIHGSGSVQTILSPKAPNLFFLYEPITLEVHLSSHPEPGYWPTGSSTDWFRSIDQTGSDNFTFVSDRFRYVASVRLFLLLFWSDPLPGSIPALVSCVVGPVQYIPGSVYSGSVYSSFG